jgi:hypothetical protein
VAEELGRNVIGIDLNEDLINSFKTNVTPGDTFAEMICGDSSAADIQDKIKTALARNTK